MRKITDFIVEKRYFVLAFFAILTCFCACLMSSVTVNYDMAKYLPDDSTTRIGMDIMNDEFDTDTSSLSLMFSGISSDEKLEIFDDLKEIDGVSEVSYDEGEDYNRDGYTLYVINVSDSADSDVALGVYDYVVSKYKDYDIYTSGEISERANPVLPTWIVGLAVGCATIILIVMCDSYVEPFLFLGAIGIAIVLNMGTNVMFGSVSNITNSITAILQLALSMDYSIMLMNRYSQERAKNKVKDNVGAMKRALYNSFSSISSSSVTTIVGLLALVFMSFTIGRDLGFVLAKGVFFSLISIFFVLPGLILIFDKLIVKTSKKSFNIRLDRLGNVSYKFRKIALVLFVIIFGCSYLLKGNLDILYTDDDNDFVGSVFDKNNQIAVIYKNDKEKVVGDYCNKLSDEMVSSVLCYGNTIGLDLPYDQFKDKLREFNVDMDIDDDLLRLVYYRYYNNEINGRMSFLEFVNFVKRDVIGNDKLNYDVPSEVVDSLDMLELLGDRTRINEKVTSSEIASLFGIDEGLVDKLLVYYNSLYGESNTAISLSEFVNFVNRDVLGNAEYASYVDSFDKNSLDRLAMFLDVNSFNSKISASNMADALGVDHSLVNSIYDYYSFKNGKNDKLSVYEFSKFILEDVAVREEYASLFDSATLDNVRLINSLSNSNFVLNDRSSSELAYILGIDYDVVRKVVLVCNLDTLNDGSMSISSFVNGVIYFYNNNLLPSSLDVSVLEGLSEFVNNSNNINYASFDKKGLELVFDKYSDGLVKQVYEGLGYDDDYEMSVAEFLDVVLDEMADSLDDDVVFHLRLIYFIVMEYDSLDSLEYSYSEMAGLLGLDEGDVLRLYNVIDYVNGDDSRVMSISSFVTFILNNYDDFSSFVDVDAISKLKYLNEIIMGSVKGNVYSVSEMASLLGFDEGLVNNVYGLYGIKCDEQYLSVKELVGFVLDNSSDSMISSNLNDSLLEELSFARNIMSSVASGKRYSSSEMASLLGISSDAVSLLYSVYDYNYSGSEGISLLDFVNFVNRDVVTDYRFSDKFDDNTRNSLGVVNKILLNTSKGYSYSYDEFYEIVSLVSDSVSSDLISLIYVYYGSRNWYDEEWTLSILELVNFLNNDIFSDELFSGFISDDMVGDGKKALALVLDSKKMLVGDEYSRMVINTKFPLESSSVFDFVNMLKDDLGDKDVYVIGDSPMALELSESFMDEMDFITVLTMVSIFVVVAVTFKSLIIPFILTFIIQCAVYIVMGILSIFGGSVYFIALLIVQSILMGACIDYAILYTSYYLESRSSMGVRESVINAYNRSIHTILTSSSILVIVTLIVGSLSSAITSKICTTISQGTFCSALLILFLLPGILACVDKFIYKRRV